jgi:hypothetical protein
MRGTIVVLRGLGGNKSYEEDYSGIKRIKVVLSDASPAA